MNEDENKIEIKTSTPTQKSKEGVVGPIIGSTIIILLIILGGLYFWSYLIENIQDVSEVKDKENLETEVEILNKEIQNTELEKIDMEIEQIEAEINSEINEFDIENSI